MTLHLGIQLGSGAFGRVYKAEATGLVKDGESITTVAVKTVLTQGSAEQGPLEALVNELKIMIHVGSNVNVVNLLGACTQNIIKGDERPFRIFLMGT
jgi:serine/threonine protein kinase